jgi:tetratricopeptide (TPR) repeat protein
VVDEGKELRASAEERGDTQSAWILDYHVNMIRLERGEAIGRQDDLLRGARDHGFPMIYIAPLAAEAAVAEGEPETARRLLVQALDETPPGEIDRISSFVRASLASDALDLATRALASGAPLDEMNEAETLLAEGMVAEAEGDVSTARDGFERAELALGGIGWVPLRAYALSGLGRCLVALGQTGAGKARLQEARSLWQWVHVEPRIAELDESLALVTSLEAEGIRGGPEGEGA